MINDKKIEIQQNIQKLLNNKYSELDDSRLKIIKTVEEHTSKLEQESKKNKDKAVDLIMNKFDEYLS